MQILQEIIKKNLYIKKLNKIILKIDHAMNEWSAIFLICTTTLFCWWLRVWFQFFQFFSLVGSFRGFLGGLNWFHVVIFCLNAGTNTFEIELKALFMLMHSLMVKVELCFLKVFEMNFFMYGMVIGNRFSTDFRILNFNDFLKIEKYRSKIKATLWVQIFLLFWNLINGFFNLNLLSSKFSFFLNFNKTVS